MDVTRIPSADDLAALQKNVGVLQALEAPKYWDAINSPDRVELYPITQGLEYTSVVTPFMSTLRNQNIEIVSVERVQNLALWQSYVVKRQTICNREKVTTDHGKLIDDDALLARVERHWLWHGTKSDILEKILQQGFNRSFCGRNATAYGKGVYFARDASYSTNPTYAEPDSSGHQYIMACRVVVGEYCVGRSDALIPDMRDPKNHILFDTTVDNTVNPSIYVTYSDSQTYPEVRTSCRVSDSSQNNAWSMLTSLDFCHLIIFTVRDQIQKNEKVGRFRFL